MQRTLHQHWQLQTKPHPHQQRQLRYVYHHAHNNAPHELKHQALFLNNRHLHRTTHWRNLHRVSPYRLQRGIAPTRTTCHILDDQTIKNNCQESNTNPTKSGTIRIFTPNMCHAELHHSRRNECYLNTNTQYHDTVTTFMRISYTPYHRRIYCKLLKNGKRSSNKGSMN